ncbi:glycosyltransferase family 9 protein [Chlorobium phaeovibrioides]|uniref:glycosyltransferase family 9 protein n=1 Tax=Chlorobium phaeovibrioides TaxID=1094 RepID=UPI0021AD5AF7|nr:glycosyltransferase family 9 protein [Chlorobium phaeovibrioides]
MQNLITETQIMHQQPFIATPASIVILARECYGDAIMQTPLIATLRQTYPASAIYIVAFTRIICDFFSADSNVTATYHAKRDLHRYFFKFLLKKYDILFNPKDHPSTTFNLNARLIRARFKVGLRNNGNEELYDYLLDIPKSTHESIRNLSLMQALGHHEITPCRPYIPTMPVSDEINAFLAELPDREYIGINISTGTPGGHRTIEQWSDLIKSFPGERFVIFSAPGDLNEKRLIEQPHKNVVPSPATKNLYEVSAVVRKLRLLVTPDTSLVHIAACSDTLLVAMYRHNPGDSQAYAPLSTLQEVIVSPTPEVVDIDTTSARTAVQRLLEKLT